MMGMLSNILIFTFLMSFSFWVFLGYSPFLVKVVACTQNPDNPVMAGTCEIAGISLSIYTVIIGMFGLIGFGVAAYMLSGTSFFPDVYKLFGVVSIFLFGFITFPVDLILFNHPSAPIPSELRVFMAGLFMLCYMTAFLFFYRQGGGS